MTLLAGRQAAAKAAPAKADTLLGRKRAETPRGEFVEMPMLGRVWVELCGDLAVAEIESAVFSAMEALKIPQTPINFVTFNTRRIALTLAWAVRNPDKIDERAGTAEEWVGLDLEMLNACGVVYTEVRERLNPLSQTELTQEDLDDIRQGIEKKNPTQLMSVGVVALSLYLLTTAAPPANSPTPPSSAGES